MFKSRSLLPMAVFSVFLSLPCFAKAVQQGDQISPGTNELLVFSGGMSRNRAIASFKVECDVVSGDVASEEDALNGRFSGVVRSKVIWARLGDTETFRFICDPNRLKTALEQGSTELPDGTHAVSVPCLDKHFIAKGEFFASHASQMKVCTINRKDVAKWHSEIVSPSPFGFDFGEGEALGPYKIIADCAGGGRKFAILPIAQVNGQALVGVKATGKDSPEAAFYLRMNPAWNFLPVEYFYTANPAKGRMFLFRTIAAQRSPQNLWFPTKVLRISRPDEAGLKNAVLLSVSSIKFNIRASDLESTFEVPAQTQFNVVGTPYFLVESKARKVNLDSLESIYQSAVVHGTHHAEMEKHLKLSAANRWYQTISALAAVIGVTLLATFVVWLYRSGKLSSAGLS